VNDLPAALDLAVFEQLPNGRSHSVGRMPGWWRMISGQSDSEHGIDLCEHFPLLELFFTECETAWDSAGLRMESDIWTEHGHHGEEQYLQAVATSSGGRRLIILRSLPQALFSYQQLAHDLELEKEKVERMSRELIDVNRELEAKRQEADRATRAKSDFLATMSHEIRTPMNAIIGMADVLSGTTLTTEQKKCVDVFQRNGVALLNLINDILDLSKVEAGKVELEAVDFDLREVVVRALEVVEVRSAAKGLFLRQSIARGIAVFLIGDPNRLRQVIINLLGNSIKFTEHGGLDVRVEPDPEDSRPGCLRFAISDSGIGIPEDKVDRIFESFSQADSSTTRRYGGTGLGLTISRQLVELLGGRIWVESAVGRGSTFFFTARFEVQADQSERTVSRATSAAAASEPLPSGLRILLADDSEDNRFLILSYLNQVQASIDVAENGEIAARMFRSGHYDLVLMDVEMPVMDGYAATREIRRFEQESGARPTPVFALTAHAFADMAARSLAAGFTGHLTKPIRKATLLEALAGHVPQMSSEHVTTRAEASAATGRIKVPIEAGMEDVVPSYLDKRRKEISQYRQALANQDFDSIRMLGHNLKGTGAGYGFAELTSIGAAIEKSAVARDVPGLSAKVDELARYIDHVELEYPE
jgi:signal transduction histidine kinase/CheY-like chemotaxis protein/HPt (histidine-containing phosphotransfer) domain-containing protein